MPGGELGAVRDAPKFSQESVALGNDCVSDSEAVWIFTRIEPFASEVELGVPNPDVPDPGAPSSAARWNRGDLPESLLLDHDASRPTILTIAFRLRLSGSRLKSQVLTCFPLASALRIPARR